MTKISTTIEHPGVECEADDEVNRDRVRKSVWQEGGPEGRVLL